jgi:PAS domain S-box-containing protein
MKKSSRAIHPNNLTGRQFQALIENAHEGIVLYDPHGRITYATPAVSKITGYKKSEVIGKLGTQFLHSADVSAARNAFFELMPEPGKSLTLFQRIKHKKGHIIWSESRLTNLINVPEINGIVSNFRDITEKMYADERARKTNELLETINRNLSEGIFMGILNKEFIYVNEAFLNLLGASSFNQLKRHKPESIFLNESDQRKFVSVLRSKHILKGVEYTFRRRDKKEFTGVLNVRLLKHEGKGDYFVGTIRDITREKETEKQLIESRNFLDNIINTVAAPIFVKDEKNRLVTFNDKFAAMVGKSRKSLLGKSSNEIGFPKELERLWYDDEEVIRTGKTITREDQIVLSKKRHDVLIVKARYVNEKNEKFLIASIAEVSHLKRAEQEIKRLHENLEGVLESSEESIFSVDSKFNYTAYNNRHKQIMKMLYNADISIGGNKIDYVKNYDDAKWIRSELKQALKGEHFVTEHLQEYPKYRGYIQITYNPIHDDQNNVKGVAVFVQDITHRKRYEQIINSINANLRAVMESTSDGIVAFDKNFKTIIFNNSFAQALKRTYDIDIAVGVNLMEVLPPPVGMRIRDNSEKVFTGKHVITETEHPGQLIIETSFNPIYDDNGGVSGVALFIRNVSERTRMEEQLKKLNQELTGQNIQLAKQERELKSALHELSERNFELDQLMYKTSHDLRSPLSSIIGLINLANLDPDREALKEYLGKIEGRAKKLDEFIRSMLDYARVNRLEEEPEDINIDAFVRSCIAELEYMENFRKVQTRLSVRPQNLVFKSDKLRLKIIFSNIISNAYKYYNGEADSYLKIEIELKEALTIRFEDNGIGIKEEYLPKIFNMFYRATDRSQGSGLGMYIVKQAVEKLKGTISLSSQYGAGTKIDITLPKMN